MDQQNVVLIHRWSLYTGSIRWKAYLWGPVKCGLYRQVVLIYRSLEEVSLYIYIVIRQRYLADLIFLALRRISKFKTIYIFHVYVLQNLRCHLILVRKMTE